MSPNSNYSDLLREFNAAGVRYLVVGGYAVMKYTEPRFTKDLDIWVDRSPENAQRVYGALKRFGAPLKDITPDDFTKPEIMYQMGVDPVRIDVITALPGLTFASAWENREDTDFGGETAYFISREDLVTTKRATNRPIDRIDLRHLARPKLR